MNRLYLRIWLAIVLTVGVLSVLIFLVWDSVRSHTETTLPRAATLRNASGEVIAQLPMQMRHTSGEPPTLQVQLPNGDSLSLPPPRRLRPDDPASADTPPPMREGHMPPPRRGGRDAEESRRQAERVQAPFWVRWGFVTTLVLLAIAVAMGTYPIVRRLTRRLEALHQAVAELEKGNLSARASVQGKDEVAQLAQQFNRAAQRIQSLMQSQRQLLANASHELRTPLTRLRMSLELMQKEPSGALQHEAKRSMNELDELIGEILLASRLEMNALHDTSARPSRPNDWALLDLSGLAAEECAKADAVLHVLGQQAIELHGSDKLLRRLLRNLLENARRHIPNDGSGQMHVVLQQDDCYTELWVCDNGTGVPLPERERVFEAFYRPLGSTETQGNVGLGLALVKSIAQQHKGTVRCGDWGLIPPAVQANISSYPLAGAVFHIQLPCLGSAPIQTSNAPA